MSPAKRRPVTCSDCALGTLSLLRPRPGRNETGWVCYDCMPMTPEEMRAELDAAEVFTVMAQMEDGWTRVTARCDGEHWTLDNRERDRSWALRRGRAGWGEVLYTTPFADRRLIQSLGGRLEG